MKTLFLSLALITLSAAPLSYAKEEISAPPLTVSSLQGQAEEPGFPFEFSVSPGKWSQATRGEIFTTGYHPQGFTLPTLKEEPAPIPYPRWAVHEGWEGTFVIAVEVLTTGEVGRWKIMESTGYSLLDEAATNAIRQWRFQPGTEKGKAVATCIQIPVHFELQEER